MAAIYVSNLVINCGATFTQKFELENVTSNSALELTGFTVQSKMRKHRSSKLPPAATFTCTVQDPAKGVIQLQLTSSQTTKIKPGRYQYDVNVTKAGEVTRVVEGSVLVRQTTTRDDEV